MSHPSPDDPTDATARTTVRESTPIHGAADERTLEKLRPWAQRQATRTYGHLPQADQDAAVLAALRDLLARGVADDSRAGRVALADHLTQRLREAHTAWCHRPGAADAPPPTIPNVPATVADVVERGLGGLERAVMQLEIGAGRDTRTARAALRLSPRDYARHRREGLAKLRAAVGGQVVGHVCEAHAPDVILAATGDDAAGDRLGVGRHRCRSCAREAQGVRRLLHQRLAVAPWPLTITPMGALAAKLAGLGGGAVGIGSATSGGGLFGGSVGGVAATVASIAAIAGGTVAVVEVGGADKPRQAASEVRPAATSTATAVSRNAVAPLATAAATAAATPVKRRTASKPRATKRPARTATPAPAKPAADATPAPATATETTAAETTPATSKPSKPAALSVPGVSDLTQDVTDTVDSVTKPVTGALPAPVREPVEQTVDGLGQTVQDVGGLVDGLLAPKP